MIYLWLTLLSEPLKIEVTNQPAHTSLTAHILEALPTFLWVLFVLAVVLIFRKPLSHFLRNLPGSISKLEIAGLKLEFAQQPQLQLEPGATEFGQLTKEDAASVSYIQPLIQEIKKPPAPHSYITINLGNGHKWLTSRLFIFALMFRQMRGLTCFVFVDNSQGVRDRYLGASSTETVRWALAMRYPWLEDAYVKAYNEVIPPQQPQPTPFIASASGKLEIAAGRDLAADLITKYVEKLRRDIPPNPAPDRQQWTPVKSSKPQPQEEHAVWIDNSRLLEDLGENLWDYYLPDFLDWKTKVSAITNTKEPFIALTAPSGRFISLLERTSVLENLAKKSLG